MTDAIVGYGEVGNAVHHTMYGAADVPPDIIDINLPTPEQRNYDVMHICIPYTNEFCETVEWYRDLHQPKHLIVWSTVPIGTCRKLGRRTIHCPIEGKHPHLERSLQASRRWIACEHPDELGWATEYFGHDNCIALPSTTWTEWLKLRSTTRYGVELAWVDYEDKVCTNLGMPHDLCRQYDADYNNLYANLGEPRYRRPILTPPRGVIGGHCVVPNAKILNEQYPHIMVGIVALYPMP